MKLVIVDSNKAWSVTIACMLINGILIGFMKMYSLIIIEYQEILEAPMSLLMFGASMINSLIGLMGPLSTFLSDRFTTWKSSMFAACLASLSVIIMAFAYNIYVQVTSAALLGLSFSIIYIPTISIPGKCHIKHQTLSQGIVTAGGSIGTLIMPFMLSQLIDIYSLRGVMLIISGFVLHFAVAAALLPTHIIAIKDDYKPILVSIQDRKKRTEGEIIDVGKWRVSISNFSRKSKLKWPPRKLWLSLTLYSIGITNVMNGYMLLSGLYGAFARHLSVSVSSSAYILMIQSCVDFVARIIIGYLVDLKLIPRWLLFCVCGIVLSAATIAAALFPSMPLFYFYLFCNATFGACLMVIFILILIDVIGLEYITASFSIYIFIQGCVAILVFYLTGKFCDETGRYDYAIGICGLQIGVGAIFIIIERFV